MDNRNIINLDEFRPVQSTACQPESTTELVDNDSEIGDDSIIEFQKPETTAGTAVLEKSETTVPDEEWKELLPFETIFHINRLVNCLNDLRGSSSNETMALRQQTVKTYTTENLLASITESDEANWQAHPSFYQAAVRELRKRGMSL